MNRRYKFNNGQGAVLCSCCSGIVREGKSITKEEKNDMLKTPSKLPPIICTDCKNTLLSVYYLGWSSESIKEDLLIRAIKLGRLDFKIGDDVKSKDLQSEDEIILNILSWKKY